MKLFLKIILSTIIFINSSNAEIVEVFKFTDEEFKTLELEKRLNGWQLKSFKESYKHKVENGISLFKKKNLK